METSILTFGLPDNIDLWLHKALMRRWLKDKARVLWNYAVRAFMWSFWHERDEEKPFESFLKLKLPSQKVLS